MKAFVNITVPMIMQLLFIRYSFWFFYAPKKIFSLNLRSFADEACRRKKIGPRLEEDRKSMTSPSPGLASEFSYYSTHGNQLENKPIVW